ncbi:hypothetical protein IBL26_18910 [Roseomonas aerophila]|uniref:Uncharacterized protein n=1 Tax=Teichococcus aerophilus TaxID=1224513 RepID=A0ABR7RQN3_9PROT|nr:hypothetical protein [Pseudoroseomonas aerophila]MBC9208925.1 hypothetical protein [Pseudoroseomonas aerophila]
MSAVSAVSAPAAEGISIREFARREGISDKIIRRAISAGYLTPLPDGKLSPAWVGSGWRKANRHADTGADTPADSADMSAPGVRTVRSAAAPVSAPAAAVAEDLEPQPRGGALKRRRAAASDEGEDGESIDFDEFARRVLGGDFPALATSERVKAAALALKQALDAQKKAGALIELALAEGVLFEVARQARDAWINWPAKIGPLLAADLGLEAATVVEALTKYVQQQLEDLGEPQPGAFEEDKPAQDVSA